MSWAIHRVGLASHDLAAAQTFFGTHLGLGEATRIDASAISFGNGSRGLRVRKPTSSISLSGNGLPVTVSVRHVAIEVADLQLVAKRLASSSMPYVDAPAGDFDVPALYTVDPAQNVVVFCQAPEMPEANQIQPWESAWKWGVHHVNLPAGDVRESVAFYTEVAGLEEGPWRAPPSRGDFSIDPSELSILPLGEFNRGLHVIRADAGFARRNNFAHNPSIGGHPAFFVQSVGDVKARLESADTIVSDAGVYAMFGMHQIYVLDPTTNMIEVNQFV